MYFYLLLITTLFSLPCFAGFQTSVQVSSNSNYGWHGPGWYYGYWFDNEDDYVAWRSGQMYYNGTYYQQDIWIGPGWYGGYWYNNENDWHNHWNGNHDGNHGNNHHDNGGDGHHGGGDHGGGDRGGGHGGGGGGHR